MLPAALRTIDMVITSRVLMFVSSAAGYRKLLKGLSSPVVSGLIYSA